MSDPVFCSRGCATAYVHVRECLRGIGEVEPPFFSALSNEALVEVYDAYHADFFRYSALEPHAPTRLEAARRLGLLKDELLKRLGRTP